MTRDPRAVAKAALYPSDLQPNPDYEYELPTVVEVDGRRCIEFDAGALVWDADLASLAQRSARGRG